MIPCDMVGHLWRRVHDKYFPRRRCTWCGHEEPDIEGMMMEMGRRGLLTGRAKRQYDKAVAQRRVR